MRFYLDGDDWEADYFASDEDNARWRNNCRRIQNMYLDNAGSAGFCDPEAPCRAAFRGRVPGCDRSMLLENGVIPDPFFDRNLDRSRWSENFSWAFRRRFRLPPDMRDKKRIQLHFCGIDYAATFFLNGRCLGLHTGMFIPVEYDVTDTIRRDGENLLAVVFRPVPQASPDHTDPYAPGPAAFAEFHRAQMSYGWDWMRGMVAAGIWDHVFLAANDRARVRDCFFRTEGRNVLLEIETVAQETGDFPLEIRLEPIGFEAADRVLTESLSLRPGENTATVRFAVENPALWYPNGYGPQPLYRLTLKLDGEVTAKTVAFRTLEMRRNPDSPDGACNQTFSFNGQPVFARGANWVPADLMHCRSGRAEYERQVRLAAEAGINIFRVWGGGIVEKTEFYDACDRYGIIVWQEFMHACSCYRKDGEYLAFKRREGEAILRKLRNHVSVSLICGGNEVQYYGEIPDSPLFVQYRELVRRFAPDLPFHTSSPDLSVPGERPHGPWHFMMHEAMNPHDRLLASELGCNGFPELESVRRFIPEADLDAPESQSWKYHFAIPCREQDWRIPLRWFDIRTPHQRCQASMFAQSDIVGYWMNHCRRRYPHTSGCFFWQYNEPWPTFALSLIDYYTLPKLAYYRLARIQRPVVLSLRDRNWCCPDGRFAAELFLTTDCAVDGVEAVFRLVTVDGRLLLERNFHGDFAAGSVRLDELEAALPAGLPGGVVLAELRLKRHGRPEFVDTLLYGVPDFKQVFAALPAAPAVTAAVAAAGPEKRLAVTLDNRGPAALLVRLALPEVPFAAVYWRDNYVTVAAGECRTVEALLTADCPAVSRVELAGWNLEKTTVPVTAAERPGKNLEVRGRDRK